MDGRLDDGIEGGSVFFLLFLGLFLVTFVRVVVDLGRQIVREVAVDAHGGGSEIGVLAELLDIGFANDRTAFHGTVILGAGDLHGARLQRNFGPLVNEGIFVGADSESVVIPGSLSYPATTIAAVSHDQSQSEVGESALNPGWAGDFSDL